MLSESMDFIQHRETEANRQNILQQNLGLITPIDSQHCEDFLI